MQGFSYDKQPVLATFISSLGGLLEMYDFVLYAFFAPTLAKLFFPHTSNFISLLSVFLVFALGYLLRPIGALYFGHVGDKFGRKRGLIITIFMMAVATVLIGCLPTYQRIGVAAPMLLVLLRCIQGFAIGGDLPGAMTFTAEHSNNDHRGLACSWIFAGVNVGILFASFVATTISSALNESQIQSYGWRIGFLCSAVLFFLGLYFRLKIAESPLFQERLSSRGKMQHRPLTQLFKTKKLVLLRSTLMMWLFCAIVAQLLLFTPTYLRSILSYPTVTALWFNTLGVLALSITIPIAGALSDRIGRKPIIMVTGLFFLFFSYPLYHYMDILKSHESALWIIILMSIMGGLVIGTMIALLTEQFSTNIRYSGVAIAYNVAFAIIGGLTPAFATYLIHITHNPAGLAINLMIGGGLSFILCLPRKIVLNETRGIDLKMD